MSATIDISIIGGYDSSPWEIFHYLTSELKEMGWTFCSKTELLIETSPSTGGFLPRFFAFDISSKTFIQTRHSPRGDEQGVISMEQAQAFLDFVSENADMFEGMPVVASIEEQLTPSDKILLALEQGVGVTGQALSHTIKNHVHEITGSMGVWDSHTKYKLMPPPMKVDNGDGIITKQPHWTWIQDNSAIQSLDCDYKLKFVCS